MRVPVATLLSSTSSKQQWRDVLVQYHRSRRAAMRLDSAVVPPTFKACANLQFVEHGTSIHADVIKMGLEWHTSSANSIMNFYIKCSLMSSASTLFDGMGNKDSVSWNTMINGILNQGSSEHGLSLFQQAKAHGFKPNVSTLVLVLQACWRLEAVSEGLNMHGIIIRDGFCNDISVQNALLSLYAKSQHLPSMRTLFDEMCERDVISWSVMIGGYAQSGRAADGLRLFPEMYVEDGIELDGLAAVSILQACSVLGNIEQGKIIHGHLIHKGFEGDLFVGNSLVDMYSKCHDMDSACMAFRQMPQMNAVSWNSMLSGLVHIEMYREALALFDSMKKAGIGWDEATMVTLLQCCKRLGWVVCCKCIHAVIVRRLSEPNLMLVNALLDAYAKCDLVDLAMSLFRRMDTRNVISWSTMLAGYANCGRPEEAISFFQEMQLAQERPNKVTILSLLEAGGVSAELKLSKCVHGVAVRHDLVKDLAVATAVVDMYAKCGDVMMSRKAFDTMHEKNIVTWNAMMGTLAMNGRGREALALLGEMETEDVKPNGVTMLLVLSACSHGGLVEEGMACLKKMSQDPSLQPSLEHYSCVVDMLGRAGDIEGAMEMIKRMPEELEAGPAAWGALLSACRSHGNHELGQGAAARVLELEPMNSAGYLLTSSMYAKRGLPGDSARMRWLMRERRVRVATGYSLVHVEQRAHKFAAWDGSHPECKEIYSMVELLHHCMKPKDNNKHPII